MDENEFELIRAGGFAVAIFLALLLQWALPHRRLAASWRENVGLWLVDVAALAAVCGACAWNAAVWTAEHGFGLLAALAVPWPIGAAAVIAALDLVSYLWHRANHRIVLLWRFHQVHHSDTTFTVTTALRFHPGELLFSLPVRLAAIVVLGGPPQAVLAFEVLFTFANLLEHGNIRLPVRLEAALGRGLVTPALHRRHHARQAGDLNSNFGTVFTVWDRLLGTYRSSTSDQMVDTGLPGAATGAVTFGRALAMPFGASVSRPFADDPPDSEAR
jgi:sterol desaturase/sphingolipid hydroxylase (fatty acid hydroxylase superfamily)